LNVAHLDICCIVGARPNFMKMAPILRALHAAGGFKPWLVHTGQHYDPSMNDVFFQELGLPKPDVHLGVGSGSQAVQTARVMIGFDEAMDKRRPDIVLVVGDVNSTLAAALVAKKRGIAAVHVEAGLRSFDEAMPEEINRVLTDRLCEVLYTTEPLAEVNLLREGVDASRIVLAGNVMIDSLHFARSRSVPVDTTLAAAGVSEAFRTRAAKGFALATLHRPSNVDDVDQLRALIAMLETAAQRLPVIFPVHPRTTQLLTKLGMAPRAADDKIALMGPVSYLSMVGLMAAAKVVMTDSGGLQEETTGLGVPCLTVRTSTERPITIEEGTNVLVGTKPADVLAAFNATLDHGGKAGRIPKYWDGHAADRIAADLKTRFASLAR
jgi:UDP-N-acetylglucosamine 2-epimerase (non-hydrolysing)